MAFFSPERPLRDLTDEEIQGYDTDGAVKISGVLSYEWIERLRKGVDYVLKNPSSLARATSVLGGGGFAGDAFMWKTHDTFRDFVFCSPASRIAMQVFTAESIRAFYDQIFAKEAGAALPTPMHEDMTSWPVKGEEICALWIPLDPCGPDSSALQVVRGSHRWDRAFPPVTPSASQRRDHNKFDSPLDYSLEDVLSWDLDIGDFVLFHPRVLHGASGTKPESGRRAFVSRWVGEGVTFQPEHAVLPLLWKHGLQRGDPIGGHLFPQVLPSSLADEVGSRWQEPDAPDSEAEKNFLEILDML